MSRKLKNWYQNKVDEEKRELIPVPVGGVGRSYSKISKYVIESGRNFNQRRLKTAVKCEELRLAH